jgi:hypothetical protein
VRAAWIASLLAACGFPPPADVARVQGTVHGLWTGSDGVALRLTVDGVNSLLLLTVTSDGPFEFPPVLAAGTSFELSIDANPTRHTCAIVSGRNGLVERTVVDIACTGPTATIAAAPPIAWVFDPTLDTQTIELPIVRQQIAFVIGGADVTAATIDGVAATLNAAAAPIALPAGQSKASIAFVAGELSKTYEIVMDRGGAAIAQATYAKASNTDARDTFGTEVAIDGDTLAVGAFDEASAATGVNPPGGQADNSAPGAGAVYVFRRSGATWVQEAYIKASNAEANDHFGASVSLSGDTLAVGAFGEASAATGVNPPNGQADNSAPGAGAVYVFERSGGGWTQTAYIKASNPSAGDGLGNEVRLVGDLLATGALGEASGIGGVDTPGAQTDKSAPQAGAVYLFRNHNGDWVQEAYVKASNPRAGAQCGETLALSPTEHTLAVGCPGEPSAATGVDAPGGQMDTSAPKAGAVYVFANGGGFISVWQQQAYVKASNTGANDQFGISVVATDELLVVGAIGEASAAVGIDPIGGQSDNSATSAGAVYAFRNLGGTWSQEAYIKASNARARSQFGNTLAMSGDVLVVAAQDEDSGASGVDPPGGEALTGASQTGAVYVYTRELGVWAKRSYVKASNARIGAFFGSWLAISGDTLVIAAFQESSAATGIDGDQSSTSAAGAGAVYVFR